MVMPRFETMDKVALAISAFMLIAGFLGLLLPDDFIIAHTSMVGRGAPAFTVFEHVTPSAARLYGLSSVLIGAVIAVYVLWAARSV
jgi:hypothetical protein